ncbi:MAG: NTP transferase domain-containing protein [bacterium]|nr:NTP transferase domain-containing protein [bacterium]
MATVLLQARLGSTRLPGKALMPIMGKPMLHYCVETLKLSPAVDRIVLVIPTKPADDRLVEFAKEHAVDCFRGSEENVLERFYLAARQFKDNYYFRATGDNPIMDYGNPRRLSDHLVTGNYDYVAEKGMPLGSVVEAFTASALEKAFNEGKTAEDIEHVTWYIKKSKRFKVSYPEAPRDYCYPQFRLTVDYPGDMDRAVRIIEALYGDGIPPFSKVIAYAGENGWL